MGKYLPRKYQKMNIKKLPPGGIFDEQFVQEKTEFFKKKSDKKIKIFYVGGVGYLYDLIPLLKVAQSNKFVELTICCRDKDWQKEKERYEEYLTDRVHIVHESGKDLEKYYKEADLCSIFFPEEEYRNFVLPIKFFEYLSHVTPIVATKGTAAGDFVIENDIGWSINTEEEFNEVLKIIKKDYKQLLSKHNNLIKTLKKNTWAQRAKTVQQDLSIK